MPPSVHASLSLAKRLSMRDPVAAQSAYADVLARYPGNKAAALGLGSDALAVGRALLAMGRAGQAAQWFDTARELPAATRDKFRAVALLQAGNPEVAADVLQRYLRLRPEDAGAWNNLGTALRMQGLGAAAAEAFATACDLEPGQVGAWFNLSSLRALEPEALALLSARAAQGGPDAAVLHFALGNGWDHLGEPDRAFPHFAQGNRLRKQALGYDLAQDARLFPHLAALLPPPLTCPAIAPRPVFIVGLPRSGTTLLERMLARHPQVTPAGELVALAQAIQDQNGLNAPLDPPRLQAIREGYLALRPKGEGGFLTDKMPLNFRLIGIAAAALPEAVFLHIHRDPMATCWSIFRHYFTDESLTNGFAWDLTDLGAFHGMYSALMAHWHGVMPGRILDISYEALTQDPAATLAPVFAHMDLPPDPACLRPDQGKGVVQTASALQVQRPIYQGSSDAWRAYSKHLDALRAALGHVAHNRIQSAPRTHSLSRTLPRDTA